jgi:predicted RNA-binding protein with PUA-like domain
MRYWLMKTEPDVYSIDDLIRDGKCPWEGVRNYQARNHMRAMKNGDRVLFYHSSVKPPTVVGIAEVCREAYVDPTQFDPKSPYHDEHSKVDKPRWDRVDVKFPSQVIDLAKEFLHISLACWSLHLLYSFYLFGINFYAILMNNETQKLPSRYTKSTFQRIHL